MANLLEAVSDHYRRVQYFMSACGQVCGQVPTMPTEHELELRVRLVLEEALEFAAASGYRVTEIDGNNFELVKNDDPDFVGMVDACADISVVNIGSLISMGVPDKPVLELVDANNFSKVSNSSRRDDGKIVKPEGHRPPPFRALLCTMLRQPAPAAVSPPPTGINSALPYVWQRGSGRMHALVDKRS